MDSEIRPENIIPGSPLFIPYKQEKPKGKGKHVKNIKINAVSVTTSDSDMPRRKSTKTKAELEKEARDRVKAKNRASHARHSADVVKWATTKAHQTQAAGKRPHQQLATKAPHRNAPKKPYTHYALIAMWEIRHFQKSVNLLIPFLPFQCLVHEITQDFWNNLHFQSSAILALQEAAEAWLIQLFESANLCAIHHGRQTIAPRTFIWSRLLIT